MINYSIVMRSVNANLFDINQAKSRIKAAEKAGQTPSPEDVALVATEKQNAFAIAQYADVMTIEKFAKHIATHGCVYSRADISAILYMAVDCMREQLLEGKKIRLGDLGDFSVSLQSKGAESADKFSAQNITGVNVNWSAAQSSRISSQTQSSTSWQAVAHRLQSSRPSRLVRRWLTSTILPMAVTILTEVTTEVATALELLELVATPLASTPSA